MRWLSVKLPKLFSTLLQQFKCSRLIVSFITSVILFGSSANALSFELQPNQSIVIGKVSDKFGRRFTVDWVSFRRIGTKDNLRYKTNSKPVYRIVESGSYYLETIHTVFTGMRSVRMKEPKSKTGIIVVEPGTVTYIGDWDILGANKKTNLSFRRETNYKKESILKFLAEYPELEKYPLRISTTNNKVINISWDDIKN